MKAGSRILTTLILPLLLGLGSSAQSAKSPNIQTLGDWLALKPEQRPPLATLHFANVPRSRDESENAFNRFRKDYLKHATPELKSEWENKTVCASGQDMKFDFRTYGHKPKNGWDLYISLHGGGNAPAELNDSQWQNQVQLYTPENAIYVAPRAPTDTWNLWHESHIDGLLDRLIESAVVTMDANPDRVYLMGYSAGGDGVYQLAPRMADRFAAASMMAGHPNETSPMGLRNIGFAIHVGAEDDGYDRNKVAGDWKRMMSKLNKGDPKGYPYRVELHKEKGHWMDLEDRVAMDWMARFTRAPFPDRVVWRQDDVMHTQFYWLAVPDEEKKPYSEVVAQRSGQTIRITHAYGIGALTILMNDQMLNLDRPVTVFYDGKQIFKGKVPRTLATIDQTMRRRNDPRVFFSAQLAIRLPKPSSEPMIIEL